MPSFTPHVFLSAASSAFRRRAIKMIALGLVSGVLLWSQPTPRQSGFEVASIKLNSMCQGSGRARKTISPTTLIVQCATLMDMVKLAYFGASEPNSFKLPHVSGGAAWVNAEFYDVQAKSDDSVSPQVATGRMLQALLQDRFHLRTHTETRETPVFRLTVAKGGSKIQEVKGGDCSPAGQSLPEGCGRLGVRLKSPNLTMQAHAVTMDQVAGYLSGGLNLDVINQTGLPGLFDFRFDFSPTEATPGFQFGPLPASSETLEQTIFEAFRSQLGLKLSPDKGPIQFLIIDQVDKPTEN